MNGFKSAMAIEFWKNDVGKGNLLIQSEGSSHCVGGDGRNGGWTDVLEVYFDWTMRIVNRNQEEQREDNVMMMNVG